MSINKVNNINFPSARERGFTLLEALLGFLILSIGMLGIASLQAVSLKAGKTSVYGSVAMMKVDELFESMRANPTALSTYEGGGANTGCSVNACNAAQLAQEDVYFWKQNIKAGLPDDATTIVTVTAATPPSKMATVDVTVSWNERSKDAASGVTKTYTTRANICTGIPC